MSDWEPSLNQRIFVAALGKMVSPLQVSDAVNAMMAMLVGLKHLPEAVFSNPAQLAVEIGSDMDRVPTLARLRKALEAWSETHLPKQAASTAGLDMPGADRAMVGFWEQYRSGEKTFDRGVTLETWLSMCRNPCPAAFRHICNTDTVAAEIAVRRGWMREPQRRQPDAEEVAYVHDRVQDAREAMQAPQGRHSRDLDHGLHRPSTVPPAALAPSPVAAPPRVAAELAAEFAAVHGRAPGTLSPEALRALRAANPSLQAVQAEQDARAERERLSQAQFVHRPMADAANDLAPVLTRPRPAMPWDDLP